MTVTDDFQIAKVNFRIDSLTHPVVGDLTVLLRSPGGIGTDLICLIDGLNDVGGTTITNMVIDDTIPAIATNDMVQATTANAPYTKSWLPVYNSPWAALVDPLRPADPVGNLSPLVGTSTKGTWTALLADVFTAAQGGTNGNGTLNAWSILVTPVHFACTAFAPAAAVTATKTVSGTFRVGGTVTYTVTHHQQRHRQSGRQRRPRVHRHPAAEPHPGERHRHQRDGGDGGQHRQLGRLARPPRRQRHHHHHRHHQLRHPGDDDQQPGHGVLRRQQRRASTRRRR